MLAIHRKPPIGGKADCSSHGGHRVVAAAAGAAAAPPARQPRRPRAPRQQPDASQPSSPQQQRWGLTPRAREVLQTLEPWVGAELAPRLSPSLTAGQTLTDTGLPDPASLTFANDLRSLREGASDLPSDLLVVICGAAVAAAAAPNLMCSLAGLQGPVGDASGAQRHGWARFARAWGAEEAARARLLRSWVFLSGRFDCRAVEETAQRLIGAGADLGGGGQGDPYTLMIRCALQERASRVLLSNAARLAGYHGDGTAARLLASASAAEARHEGAFSAVVAALFDLDPDGALMALADVAKTGLVLPNARMDDGWHSDGNQYSPQMPPLSKNDTQTSQEQLQGGLQPSAGESISGSSGSSGSRSGRGGERATALYRDWAAVADASGALTIEDMATGLEQCMADWNVPRLRPRTPEAAAAAAALARLPADAKRMAEVQLERRLRGRRSGGGGSGNGGGGGSGARAVAFSWVHRREVLLG